MSRLLTAPKQDRRYAKMLFRVGFEHHTAEAST